MSSKLINDVMHDLLNKVRIIGKIREGQKLDTSRNLSVYTDSILSWIMRKYNRDSKDETIRYLRDLYKSLQQNVEFIITEVQNSHFDSCQNQAKLSVQKNNQSSPNPSHAIYILINVATELKTSIKGLDNLSKTYSTYPTTIASIEGIIRDYVLVTYTSVLNVIPKDKLTDDLRESIMYNGVIIYTALTNL